MAGEAINRPSSDRGRPARAGDGTALPPEDLVVANGWVVQPGEAAARLSSGGVQVVDVREPEEFRTFRIPGSKSIPMADVEKRQGEIDPEKETYVVCLSGMRSAYVTAHLRHLGFGRVYNVAGGIRAWVKDGHPVERG